VKAFVLEDLLDGSWARLFIGTGFCWLCIVVVGIQSAENGWWIMHGVLGGNLYLSWTEIQNVRLVMDSKSLPNQEFENILTWQTSCRCLAGKRARCN